MYTLEEAFKLSYFALDSYFFKNEKRAGYEKTIDDLAVFLSAMNPYIYISDELLSMDPAYYSDWKNIAKSQDIIEVENEEGVLQLMLTFMRKYRDSFDFELNYAINYFQEKGISSFEWKKGKEKLGWSREEIGEEIDKIMQKQDLLRELTKKIKLSNVAGCMSNVEVYLKNQFEQIENSKVFHERREKLQSIVAATEKFKEDMRTKYDRNLYAIELREPSMKYLAFIKNTIAQYDYLQFAANIFDLLKNPIVFQSIFKKDRKMDGEFFAEMEQLLGMVGVSDMLEGDLTSGEVLAVAVLVAGAVLTDILTQ